MQHGNRHRHFEPPHDMEPGAPETLEALDAARVTEGIARWAWEQRPEVFQIHQHIATHTPEDVARWVLDSGDPIDLDATSEFTPEVIHD